MIEYRVSIYGRSIDEWDKLAKWVIDNKLFSANIRWLIQVPHLYNIYRESNTVTQYPQRHPELHVFLQRVIGFDSVDDESKPERRIYKDYPLPKDWTTNGNPPYSYCLYYMYANLCPLSSWRAAQGFTTFVLRPHCGEAGDTDHLTGAFYKGAAY